MKQSSFLIFISRFINILSDYSLPIDSDLEQNNVFIAVKTTQQHEKTSLPIILDTWFTLAKNQVWFFTDQDKTNEIEAYQHITKNHIIVTDCPKTHNIIDHCCRTNAELSVNLTNSEGENIKWLCLFDDDNYVNVPKLVEELQKYDHKRSWYLGRKYQRGRPSSMRTIINNEQNNYYFANLGAGVCLSRALLLEMEPYLRYDGFVQLCKTLRLPDAITLGFLIETKMGVDLTDVPTFHSRLDALEDISCENLKHQISIGYDFNLNGRSQIITVPGFHLDDDPSRFYSLHCFLRYCSRKLKQRFKSEGIFNCIKSSTSPIPQTTKEIVSTTIPSTSSTLGSIPWTPGQSTARYQTIFSPSRQNSRKSDRHAEGSKLRQVVSKSLNHTWA